LESPDRTCTAPPSPLALDPTAMLMDPPLLDAEDPLPKLKPRCFRYDNYNI